MKYDTLIFDLDGTLLNTIDDLTDSDRLIDHQITDGDILQVL